MSISRTQKNTFKKLITSFFLLVFLFSILTPLKTSAATQTLTVARYAEEWNSAGDKVRWGFKINTTNVPDNTNVNVGTYVGSNYTYQTLENVTIKNNSGEYDTKTTLDPNTHYRLIFMISNTTISNVFEATTPKSNTPAGSNLIMSTNGNPSTAIGSQTPPPATPPPAPPQKKVDTDVVYKPLAPLPDGTGKLRDSFDTSQPCAFGTYVNILIKLFLGICAVLAMIMIVWGGIQYMTSELISSKEAGKDSIAHAIFGFLLALSAYLILNTINPDLLNACLDKIPKAQITITPETIEETIGISGRTAVVDGKTLTACDESQIVPITLFGVGVVGGVNKLIVPDLQKMDADWKKDPKHYQVRAIAGYSCRSVKGHPDKTSAHAYGIALDINPGTNPYLSGSTRCVTDMPQTFVDLIKSRGWGWGGNWSSVKDAMHFSKLPSEVGSNNACAS